jgi:hypothetical protein
LGISNPSLFSASAEWDDYLINIARQIDE